MSSFRRLILIGIIVAVTAPYIAAQSTKKRPTPATPTIPLNQSIASALSVVEESPAYRRFSVEIPETVFSIEIAIENSPADLDIIVYNGADEIVAYSELARYNETLTLTRIGDPSLVPGRYNIEIGYQYSEPPRVDARRLTEIPFDLTVRAVIPEIAGTVSPGDTRRARLTPDEGMMQLYEIEVPIGTSALRLDISDTAADVDLFLNRDRPAVDPYAADYWSQSVRAFESLTIDRDSNPPLRPGTYYVTVIDQLSDAYPVEYLLSVSDRAEAPAHLQRTPVPPRAATRLDRLLLSTVEILTFNGGGSGVVVHPDGYIVTNYHVILADSGRPADTITVGYSDDYGTPPTEMYLAEVVETLEDRDLALLKIESGRYGEPIPEGTEFEYLEARFDSTPQIGNDLRFIGYPSIGGTGSRASITFTRGTVAGYQDVPFGRLIKTDAEINEGSSGGAAIDDEYRLVGFPTEVVGLDAGQLAFIYPVSAIPDRWRRIIAR